MFLKYTDMSRFLLSLLTQPNMYARGILFGKMKYELGDHSFVRCPELGLSADIEFKTKGYFGGTYNAIGGHIKNDKTGEILYELAGMWNGEMTITDKRVSLDRQNVRSMIFTDTLVRLARRMFSSMPPMPNQQSQPLEAWMSKMTESLKNCGTPRPRLSRHEITNWPQMRRPRSKTCREMRQPEEPKKVWSGILGSSKLSEADPVDLKKGRRIWTGS
jgi:hypothetical protein